MYSYSYYEWIWNGRCDVYWWPNFLYLQSVLPSNYENICFNWLWLISVEAINFVFLIMIFIVYTKFKRLAYYCAMGMFMACFLSVLVITIVKDYILIDYQSP